MIAVKRLQSLLLVLLVALVALGAYFVSLRVATERNELSRVQRQIALARSDIRYLETEFRARANMRQLEQWNAEDFRYSAVSAEHYLNGERALASLDGIEPNGPTFVAPPVMVAMVEDGEETQSLPAPSPAVLQIRSDVSTIRAAQAEDGRSHAAADMGTQKTMVRKDGENTDGTKSSAQSAKPAQMAKVDKPAQPNAIARQAERVAMLDARLLDDRTLGDIGRRAAAEKRSDIR